MTRKMSSRPLIVAIIAILEMLSGALIIFYGIISILAGSIFGEAQDVPDYAKLIAISFGAAIILAGFLLLVVGLIVFIYGRALWHLSKTAWYVTIILLGLSVFGILSNLTEFLTALQSMTFAVLLWPVITILLFIYFIQIRDKFH